MALTAGARAAIDQIAAAAAPFDTLTLAQARAGLAKTLAGLAAPPEEVGAIEEREVSVDSRSVRVRIYRPAAGGPHPLVLTLHGGGWALGDLDTHDTLARAICNAAPAVVVSVEYRLAPENRFPAALEDAEACLRWAAAEARSLGADPARLVLLGDSAGGNLSAGLALRVRDRGGPAIAAQVLIYPVLDARCDTPSFTENATGYFLTRQKMHWFWQMYLPEGDDGANPCASPLRAESFAGLPPTFVVTAEHDPLRDEGERFAEALRRAGVAATARRWNGLIHGFASMGKCIPESREAIDWCAAAIRGASPRAAER